MLSPNSGTRIYPGPMEGYWWKTRLFPLCFWLAFVPPPRMSTPPAAGILSQRESVTSQVAEHREGDLRHDRDAEKDDLPTAQTALL